MELLQSILFAEFLGTPAYFWLTFIIIVIALLAFDLGILHTEDRKYPPARVSCSTAVIW